MSMISLREIIAFADNFNISAKALILKILEMRNA